MKKNINKQKEKLDNNLTQLGQELINQVFSENLNIKQIYTIVNIPAFLYSFIEQLSETYNLSIEEMVSSLASEGLQEGLKQRVKQVVNNRSAGNDNQVLDTLNLNTKPFQDNIKKLNELSEKVVALTQSVEQIIK